MYRKGQKIRHPSGRVVVNSLLLVAATAGAQQFHTSPYCWDEPRTFVSATAVPVEFAVSRVEPVRDIEGKPSPNGAYNFLIESSAGNSDVEPYSRLLVFNERPYLLEVRFPNAKSISEAKWINENLIYVRVWWGRISGSDIVLDAEKEAIVFRQHIEDGTLAFQQYRQCAEDAWKDDPECHCAGDPEVGEPN